MSDHGTRLPTPRRRVLALLVLVLGLSGLGVAAPPSAADPGDIGWEGPSFEGASGSPSGSKPQSKVWFNDGLWWATLYDAASGDFHIWRLDVAGRTWVDTGTLVDTRPGSRSDALWTGQHLYVANHVFSESGNATGNPAQLRRYSYDATSKRYTADAGFPVAINDVRSETLVIDREPTGRLWATWTQGGQVMVAHSTTNDQTWSAPFALPVQGTAVSSDDISAVVAYRSDRIGIMWSNQDDETMSFAYHLNGSAPGSWSAREIAYSGSGAADDHIDFAAVQDVGGRVLAAVKTSRSGSAVLTHLLDRNPTTGAWTSHPYGLGGDNHTRPIAVVDSEHQRVHMFATSGQSGGSIYEKSAPLSAIDFPAGRGDAVLTDASSADINNATSTKQTVSSATGLVVIATNDTTRRYWTHYDPLDGPGPGPTTPTASFTRTPTTGPAPLDVSFTDTSTGTPTSWSWSFGDGGTSTAQNPTHRYTAPGTYSVSLTATNAAGSDTVTQSGAVTVTTTPPAGTPTTFTATADGLVKNTSPTRGYGADPTLQVRAAPDPVYQSFVRFDVAGLAGAPTAARLRLFVTDASPTGGTATRVGTGWTEGSLTWNTRPAAVGGALGTAGPAVAGQWVEYDVTGGVTGNGAVAFRIDTSSTNSLITSSREGAHAPQLVVTAGATPPPPTKPTASFTRTPASGTAPLDVAFTDTSSGSPTSWSWTFGDGGTSTAQHPTHRYTAPGTYAVALTATNAAGSDTVTRTGSVVVSSSPPSGSPVTYTPTADGYVQSGSPAKAYGTATALQVRAPSPEYLAYLRFDVAGLAAAPSSATLRLWVTDGSVGGGAVTRVGTGWTEGSLTYDSRPAAIGGTVAGVGPTTAGTWVEIDVTAAITGPGPVALRLSTSSTNSAIYSSREGSRPPQLVVVP